MENLNAMPTFLIHDVRAIGCFFELMLSLKPLRPTRPDYTAWPMGSPFSSPLSLQLAVCLLMSPSDHQGLITLLSSPFDHLSAHHLAGSLL
jgi:hypothetical protein